MRKIVLVLLCCAASFVTYAQNENTDCSDLLDSMVDYAVSFKGVPYVLGGKNADGFDCSGLVYYVYMNFGTIIPLYSRDQWKTGELILMGDVRRGDLVFFVETEYPYYEITHVGMAITDYDEETDSFLFIHSNKSEMCVSVSDFRSHWLHKYFAGIRRYNICE